MAAGEEEVVISVAGKPLLELVGCERPSSPRTPGLLKGTLVVKPGFDELPPGFGEVVE
ncbi:MAG TPA: hypothetical protein VNJ46_03460 [Gaiellaceae bacterium]|nr:hypothetical protein [Gaiellaceae bacterium]